MAGKLLIILFVLYFLVLPRLVAQNRRGNGKPNLAPTPENVEPHIYPLVAALNATGLCVTRASCDGHWESLFYISQPYLAFSGDTRLAEKLDALLYLETELPWNLSAGFAMPDRELCFRLELNMDVLWNYRIFWPWHRRKFLRQFDRDIRHLAHVVQAITIEIQAMTKPSTHT